MSSPVLSSCSSSCATTVASAASPAVAEDGKGGVEAAEDLELAVKLRTMKLQAEWCKKAAARSRSCIRPRSSRI